jgi:hypothetical protein
MCLLGNFCLLELRYLDSKFQTEMDFQTGDWAIGKRWEAEILQGAPSLISGIRLFWSIG